MDFIPPTFQSSEFISILQFCTDKANTFEYVTSSYALKNNLIKVTEINRQGSVNKIMVKNKSDKFVFFMDGDILLGAKQDRVVNVSLLIEPMEETYIPVSCVEAGRWRISAPSFIASEIVLPPVFRREKMQQVAFNLKSHGTFMADQGAVWRRVKEYSYKHGISSPTSEFYEIYEEKKEKFDDSIKNLQYLSPANGIALFIKNKLVSIDIFNRSEVLEEYFSKILRGVVFDVSFLEDNNTIDEKEAFQIFTKTLKEFEKITPQFYKSVGAGIDKRFEAENLKGFELDYENNLIHFSGSVL